MTLSKLFASMTIFAMSFASYAEDFKQTCAKTLSSEPYCVKIASSEEFCKRADQQMLDQAVQCINQIKGVAGPAGAGYLCLGLDITSADPEMNKSYCK
jgi:hypothetical protein